MTSLELQQAKEVDLGPLTVVDMGGRHHLGYLARLHAENSPETDVPEDMYLLRGVDQEPKLILHVGHHDHVGEVELEPVDDQPVRSLQVVGAMRIALQKSRLKKGRVNLAEAHLPQNIFDIDTGIKHDKDDPSVVFIEAAA